MTTSLLDAVEIDPPGTPTGCVIWLHGLGADGHDFEPLIPQLGIVESLGVRVVLPHAPKRAVTINAGLRMPAWYDVAALDFRFREDDTGIRASQQQLEALIGREISAGIPSEHIVLAGFSQGGAIALHTGLRYPRPLAGILALSTYLPLRDTLTGEAAVANRATPILMLHGTIDPVVPVQLALASRDFLVQQGHDVGWHTWPMAHAVCAEEVAVVSEWLVRVLGE
ncbi:MAG: carboxylesterase [Gammaproteobacteria bacterium]|jgi:phospholipase/carboxylesterase